MLYEDESVVCRFLFFSRCIRNEPPIEPYARGLDPLRLNIQLALVRQDIHRTSSTHPANPLLLNLLQILFLNKMDLFAEKLPRSPLGHYFPDYQGGDNYNTACDYLLHRFVSLNQSAATKQIYAHTCATDTWQIKCFKISYPAPAAFERVWAAQSDWAVSHGHSLLWCWMNYTLTYTFSCFFYSFFHPLSSLPSFFSLITVLLISFLSLLFIVNNHLASLILLPLPLSWSSTHSFDTICHLNLFFLATPSPCRSLVADPMSHTSAPSQYCVYHPTPSHHCRCRRC
jgi:hypothetical protein